MLFLVGDSSIAKKDDFNKVSQVFKYNVTAASPTTKFDCANWLLQKSSIQAIFLLCQVDLFRFELCCVQKGV